MTDEELRALWLNLNVAQRDIARMLHTSEAKVLLRVEAMGLQRRPRVGSRRYVPDWDAMVADYESGLAVRIVARKHKVDYRSLQTECDKRGVTNRFRKKRAEVPPPPPKPIPAGPDLATETGRLLATKGKWSALAAFATALGISQPEAQRRYHFARASA